MTNDSKCGRFDVFLKDHVRERYGHQIAIGAGGHTWGCVPKWERLRDPGWLEGSARGRYLRDHVPPRRLATEASGVDEARSALVSGLSGVNGRTQAAGPCGG
jgi:hypothetical protein